MARRRLDRATRWRVMEVEAWRTIGRRHAYMIAFGPYFGRIMLLVAAVVALMVLWLKVDHVKLGIGALILAAVLAGVWIVINQAHDGVQARQAKRAAGQPVKTGFGFGWAVAGVVILLVGTGWLALWSPYA